jgi:hypothetical protein
VGAAAAPTAAAAGSRPGSCRVTGRSSSSVLAAGSSGGGSTAAAAAAAAAVMSLEQLESVVFECLMGFAERVLPGYYSPAMVAPQVCVGVVGLVGGVGISQNERECCAVLGRTESQMMVGKWFALLRKSGCLPDGFCRDISCWVLQPCNGGTTGW